MTAMMAQQGSGSSYNITAVGYATGVYGASARTTFSPLNVLPARLAVRWVGLAIGLYEDSLAKSPTIKALSPSYQTLD